MNYINNSIYTKIDYLPSIAIKFSNTKNTKQNFNE